MPNRTIAIGDIHGCDVAFEVLLDHLQPDSTDSLIVLGDVVDRGPNTRRAVELLLELHRQCHVIFLKGNHEEMMQHALVESTVNGAWLTFGGESTLLSYGGTFDGIPNEHFEFLFGGRNYWETDTEIFVHAGLIPELPLNEQPPEALRWQHLTGEETPHVSGKRVICGHTALYGGYPVVGNGWVCIDTFVYGGMFLTALDIGTDTIHQARQSGELRYGIKLDELT